jgi:cation-transporting ATPase 13A3/4/5
VVAPENTTIYIVCLSQFIILALVFNKGHPHRAPLRTNVGLVVAVLGQAVFLLYTLFAGSAFNSNVQQLMPPDSVVSPGFRGALFALIAANAVVAFLAELLCAGIQWTVRKSQKGLKYRATKKQAAAMASGGVQSAQQPAFL